MNTIRNMQMSHNFILLLIADFISSFGSAMTSVALTLFIYSGTNSLMASALFSVITILPQLIISVFLPKIKINASFRAIFSVGEIFCAVPITIMLLAKSVITVYIAFFVYAAVFFVLECLRAEYLKQITADSAMGKRQSASRIVNTVVTVAGPLAGGSLLSQFGIRSIYLFDIATYIIAALIILFIKGNQKPVAVEPETTTCLPLKICENKDVFAGGLFITFIGGAVSILTIEYIYNVLNADAIHYSALMSAMALGGLIGSVIGTLPFVQRNLRRISRFCTLIMGCVLLSVILKPGFAALICILIISGVLSSLVMLYYSVQLFIRSKQDEIRGQYAAFQNIIDISTAASKPLGAVANQLIGCIKAISLLGAVFFIKGIALYAHNPKSDKLS